MRDRGTRRWATAPTAAVPSSGVRSPLTGSDRIDWLRSLPTSRLVAAWRRQFGIDIRPTLRGITEIQQYRCLDSELEFFQPLEAAGGAELYEALQRIPGYYQSNKWEHDRALEDLAGLDNVLEVGCGDGAFLNRLPAIGIDHAEGLELNAQAAAAARQQGLQVRVASVEESASKAPGKYDAVCAFQVVEHVPDPGSLLEAMIQLVRPGGRVIISVPNAESFLRLDPLHLLDLPPHHMTRWTVRTLEWLSTRFGVEVLRVRCEPLAAYHAIPWLQLQIQRYLPVRPVSWACAVLLSPLLANRSLRSRILGHTVYACYRKV